MKFVRVLLIGLYIFFLTGIYVSFSNANPFNYFLIVSFIIYANKLVFKNIRTGLVFFLFFSFFNCLYDFIQLIIILGFLIYFSYYQYKLFQKNQVFQDSKPLDFFAETECIKDFES